MRAILILAPMIFLAAQAATAADLRVVPRPQPTSQPKSLPTSQPGAAAPASDVSIQGYGSHDASCLAWTDGCRNCERADDGPSCSNIGIACQPGAIRCTARK